MYIRRDASYYSAAPGERCYYTANPTYYTPSRNVTYLP